MQHSARGQSRVSASRRCAGELPGNSVRSASTKEWKRKIGLWLVVAWVAVVLGATSPARADYAGPVHSDEQIKQLMEYRGPRTNPVLLRVWQTEFFGERFNRAIAVSEGGGYRVNWGRAKLEDATTDALRNCRDRTGSNCSLYAANMQITYPGLEYKVPELNVQFGDFTFNNQYFFYGPRRAKGVLVWSHGTLNINGGCDDQRGAAAWAFVTRFNLAGWDVLRFDRDPCFDTTPRAFAQMGNSLPQLRDAGYQKIVLAGQSRGAWHSIQALEIPQISLYISAVIAISPASHGTRAKYVMSQGSEDWKYMIDHLNVPQTPVAIFMFSHDDYIPDAAPRADYARTILSQRGQKLILVYEDDDEMVRNSEGYFSGHSAARSQKFTRKYSDCLIRFASDGNKTDPCN